MQSKAQDSDGPESPVRDTAALAHYFEQLNSIDAASASGMHPLNRGFPLGMQLDRYLEADAHSQPNVHLDPQTFWAVREGIEKTYTGRRGARERIAEQRTRLNSEIRQPGNERVVPIGAFIAGAVSLDSFEFATAIAAVRRGRPSRLKRRDAIAVYGGSVLRERVVGPEVTFALVEEGAFFGASTGAAAELNLADGRGWRRVRAGNTITITYAVPGEKGIGVRLRWRGRRYESYSRLNVVPPLPADGVVADLAGSTSGLGNRSPISGLEVFAQAGCDGVFDRPVVIIEGYDAKNKRGFRSLSTSSRLFPKGFGTEVTTCSSSISTTALTTSSPMRAASGGCFRACGPTSCCGTLTSPSPSSGRAWVA